MWHSISLYADQIRYETERAMLIQLATDEQFWHPKKCIRHVNYGGSARDLITVSIADTMTIKTHRPAPAPNSNSTIKKDEAEWTAAEFIERYADACVAVNPAKVTEPVKVGNLSELVALLFAATEHLKYPKLRVSTEAGDVVVSRAGDRSKNAGWLYVKSTGGFDEATYFGKVNPDTGVFLPSRDATPDVTAALKRFADDPAKVASEYGKLTGNCCFCSRPLSDERSTEVGYGATCAKHYALPWGA